MYNISKDDGPAWAYDQHYVTSADAQAGVAITDAAPTGKNVVIDDILISTDTAMNVILKSGTTATAFFKTFLYSYVPVFISFRDGLRCPDAAEAVKAFASVAGNIAIACSYHYDPPVSTQTVSEGGA
jgi:hypothetical protein